VSSSELEAELKRTIQLYNRFHSPQVVAKLVVASPMLVTVSFSGGVCYGCGVTDIVDEFSHELKALTGKWELKVNKTRQVTPRSFEADYSVKEK
jgi:hypothetical protein